MANDDEGQARYGRLTDVIHVLALRSTTAVSNLSQLHTYYLKSHDEDMVWLPESVVLTLFFLLRWVGYLVNTYRYITRR